MLEAMGAPVRVDGLLVEVERTASLDPLDVDVPGDFSAAAFWLIAAALVRESRVSLLGVGVNPTRTALADVLTAAGFRFTRSKPRFVAREPVADLQV